MEFLFHNHCYEFKPLEGGVTGWQTLMSHTDAKLVKMEFDLYWLTQARAGSVGDAGKVCGPGAGDPFEGPDGRSAGRL